MIQLDDHRYWLYAAVDADTHRPLHVRLYPTRTQALTEMFFPELREKYLIDDAIFLVDSAPWLQAALDRDDLRFQYERHGNRNRIKRIFREIKLQTYQFSICFSHADPETAESGLHTFAVLHNALI